MWTVIPYCVLMPQHAFWSWHCLASSLTFVLPCCISPGARWDVSWWPAESDCLHYPWPPGKTPFSASLISSFLLCCYVTVMSSNQIHSSLYDFIWILKELFHVFLKKFHPNIKKKKNDNPHTSSIVQYAGYTSRATGRDVSRGMRKTGIGARQRHHTHTFIS